MHAPLYYTIGTWLGMQLEFEFDNGIILGKCKVLDHYKWTEFIGNCYKPPKVKRQWKKGRREIKNQANFLNEVLGEKQIAS